MELLGQQIFKVHRTSLEMRRIDIGDIIADNFLTQISGFQPPGKVIEVWRIHYLFQHAGITPFLPATF
jgi:hypothetical protein